MSTQHLQKESLWGRKKPQRSTFEPKQAGWLPLGTNWNLDVKSGDMILFGILPNPPCRAEQIIHTKWLFPMFLNRFPPGPANPPGYELPMGGDGLRRVASWETYLFEFPTIRHSGDHLRKLLLLALQDSIHVLHRALRQPTDFEEQSQGHNSLQLPWCGSSQKWTLKRSLLGLFFWTATH